MTADTPLSLPQSPAKNLQKSMAGNMIYKVGGNESKSWPAAAVTGAILWARELAGVVIKLNCLL